MDDEKLDKQVSLKLPVGHLLLVWDILANNLENTSYKDVFSEEEQRAIWALQDLCEQKLIDNGYSSTPEKEWDKLIEQATEFVKSIPVDFLD